MKILDFLDSIIEGWDCSILIIHHAGKDSSKRGRGSSVLEDWVDSYLKLQKVSKSNEPLKIKLNTVFLRHAPLWAEPITAELQDFEFVAVEGVLTVKQQVLKFIKDKNRAVKPKELFEAKIGSNTSTYSALKELATEGKIVKAQFGQYRLV